MSKYRVMVEPHLKHLVLFMCRHCALHLINVTENNHVPVANLGGIPRVFSKQSLSLLSSS